MSGCGSATSRPTSRPACPAACAPHRARLGAHLRGGLTHRHGGAVDAHLAECAECRRLADELVDVNRLLARAVAPVFALAGGGSSLLGSVGAGTGPTTIGGGSVAGPVAGSAGASAAAGGSATSGSATTGAVGGGIGAGGAAVGAAGSAIGAAAVAKVAAVVVAVVGLVAVSPIARRDDPDRPSVEVSGPASVESAARRPTTGTGAPPPTTAAPSAPGPAPSAPAPDPSAAEGSGIAVDAELDLGGGDLGLDVGVEVPLAPIPGGGVDAQVGAGLTRGVQVLATWRAGALGTGTLALDVANPDADALVDAQLVVDLSPGARPTSLLGTTCHATDPGLVGAVLSLLGSLTCGLGAVGSSDATTVSLPLAVLGSGQTAHARVIEAGVEVASTTVDLTR